MQLDLKRISLNRTHTHAHTHTHTDTHARTHTYTHRGRYRDEILNMATDSIIIDSIFVPHTHYNKLAL